VEIVVIEAGVFEVWIALSLSHAGYQVTLLDHQGPGNKKSSSTGESRIIRSAYGAEKVYSVMARRSLQLWADFFRKENHLDYFRRTGVLWMAQVHFVFACGSWLPKLFDVLSNVIRPTRQDFFFFAVPDNVNQFREGVCPVWIDRTEPKIA
jgi:hypothetical protein